MSTENEGLLRNVTREVLAELLPGLLEEALATSASSGNGNGHRAQPPSATGTEGDPVVPQVPAPPVPMVHRPYGWQAPEPSTPESIEHPAQAPVPDGVTVENVALRSDAELDAFVRALVRRLESPGNRTAILSGKVRFQLVAAPVAGASGTATIRVETGAVTERAVKEAARAGARLVLSSRAVLTPMARDRARSLGVEIQKERPC